MSSIHLILRDLRLIAMHTLITDTFDVTQEDKPVYFCPTRIYHRYNEQQGEWEGSSQDDGKHRPYPQH